MQTGLASIETADIPDTPLPCQAQGHRLHSGHAAPDLAQYGLREQGLVADTECGEHRLAGPEKDLQRKINSELGD